MAGFSNVVDIDIYNIITKYQHEHNIRHINRNIYASMSFDIIKINNLLHRKCSNDMKNSYVTAV